MAHSTAFRVASLAVLLFALCAALPALAQAGARGQDSDNPGGSCSACGAANWLFVDSFESAGACRWSARVGSSEFCTSTCGDCSVTQGEVCDDGNSVSETSCPYGTSVCESCSGSCDQVLALAGGYCGDGFQDLEEECDDGNTISETDCAYGISSCNICDSACSNSPRTGPVCGDGVVHFPEELCDDGNTAACGGCSANCRSSQGASSAGMIVVVDGTEIADGETVNLGDGGFSPDLVFEFDKNGSVAGGHVPVVITPANSESAVAAVLVSAINTSALFLQAVHGAGPIVQLTHQIATSLGNATLTENVMDTGFVVTNLTGGQGGDCSAGIACTQASDCASFSCLNGFCQ